MSWFSHRQNAGGFILGSGLLPLTMGTRHAWSLWVVVLTLASVLLISGCVSQRHPRMATAQVNGEEAAPMAQDESWSDRTGRVMVAVLVVVVTVGIILVPILLL